MLPKLFLPDQDGTGSRNDPFEAAFFRKSLDELASNFDESTSWDPEFGELKFSQYVDFRMHRTQ